MSEDAGPHTAEPKTEPSAEDLRMTFTGHLGELRSRLVRSVVAVIAGFIVCYIFSNTLIEILSRPLTPLQSLSTATVDPNGQSVDLGIQWTVLNPLEPVLVKLKLAAYGGLLFAFPVILFQICSFVFPGLNSKERSVIQVLILGCSVLAAAGAAVAYWVVFPMVLPYLIQFAPDFVHIQLRLNETLSLILKGLLGFAVAFQFPMIIVTLVYMGILTPQVLKEYRRVAIVGIFVGAAMLTPPDPLSMVFMAMPLIILYEMSIWASMLIVRRKMKTETEQ